MIHESLYDLLYFPYICHIFPCSLHFQDMSASETANGFHVPYKLTEKVYGNKSEEFELYI